MRTLLINFFVLSGLLFFLAAIGEFYFHEKIEIQPPMTLADAALGYRLRPNLNINVFSPGNFKANYQTDANGWRIGEASHKPDSAVSILGLGDSFTFGIGVDFDKTYLHRLELKVSDEKAAQVFNTGVMGWGTAQQLLFYESEGKNLGANIVVLGFYENDVLDSLHFGQFQLSEGSLVENKLVNHIDPARQWIRFIPFYDTLISHSSLAAWMRLQFFALRRNQRSNTIVPSEKINLEATQLTQKIILRLKERVEANGSQLVLLLIPSREEVTGTLKNSYLNQIRIFCTQSNLHCVDSLDAFQKSHAVGTLLYFPTDTHWTKEGHHLAASLLFQYLKTNGLY